MFKAFIVFSILAILLVSCNASSDGQVWRFTRFAKIENGLLLPRGHSPVVWLKKRSVVAESHIALFFGYINNLNSCGEFAELYNKAYPEVHYFCAEI